MTSEHTDDGLDGLSAKALHDLAVSRAKHHLDARFFWDLMKVLPMAEVAAGEWDEAEDDVFRISATSTTSPTPVAARSRRTCGRSISTTCGATA